MPTKALFVNKNPKRLLIASALYGIIWAIAAVLLLLFLQERLSVLWKDYRDNQQALTSLDNQILQTQSLQRSTVALQPRLTQLSELLPKEKGDSLYLAELTAVAAEHNIVLGALTIGGESERAESTTETQTATPVQLTQLTPQGTLGVYQVSLTASGRYPDFVRFFTALQNFYRFSQVNDLSLSSSSDEGAVSAAFTLHTFVDLTV